MCISPVTLPDGKTVACHECWQCREQAIDDWVGRNIAESRTAKWSRAVTLTYGRSKLRGEVLHERAIVLTYSDVQKWIKLLRFHGFPVRYFVTGEFGSLNGRAHWHVMLYGSGDMPEHQLDADYFQGGHWEHGWSFWTNPSHEAIRYNCKYILKDQGDDQKQGHLAMSKKPPLGALYFERLARQYVDQGLAPQDLFYTFPEVLRYKADGSVEKRRFRLKARSAELFLDAYLASWRDKRPGKPRPVSPLLDAWERYGLVNVPDEERAEELRIADIEEREAEAEFMQRLAIPDVSKPEVDERFSWMPASKIVWDNVARAWRAPWHDGREVHWKYHSAQGRYRWRFIDGTVAQAMVPPKWRPRPAPPVLPWSQRAYFLKDEYIRNMCGGSCRETLNG